MNKILIAFGIRKSEPLVTLQISNLTTIPVWSSFICGQGFSGATAQILKRGIPGKTADIATDLPQSSIQRTTTDILTTGDWTNQSGSWPCFIFNPGKNMFFKPGEIDQIIILGLVGQEPTPTPSGLLFGVFNNERGISSVDPFVSPVPSINTYTFTSYERIDVSNIPHSYFFVNKQNTITTSFENKQLAAKFAYSPDTYLVQKYTEKVQYTPYDLISNVGGLTTYALAVWFILFGRGKYRSWGLIQRYVLRNSPDARKKDHSNTLLPFTNEKSQDIDNNSTLVSSKNFDDEDRPSSAFYFSTSGTPTQSRFTNSLSPNTITPQSYYSSKELNKRIEAKINQKLWFVEQTLNQQTLNRHYLSGFKLRRYDDDIKKLEQLGFDTSYDDDNNEYVALTPPPANHHNWNSFDSNVQNNHKNIQIPPSLIPGNKRSNDNLNPEEQRSQYPNVVVGQIPLEKKQKGGNSGIGNGNYQQFVNTSTNISTGFATTSPSSYPPQILQSNNLSSIPPSLQSSVINNQGKIQADAPQAGPPQTDASQADASQGEFIGLRCSGCPPYSNKHLLWLRLIALL
ncbi:hypothetical protein RhiirA1_429086 [Rhizophagus irregularis]|uniref:Uncharacterized protein n=2 Tax=Rhizophagus irregularis TaxID=588596 RepID=A0A2N0QZH1_9GLOM|nr:hypothetical protein RhiirA1_429086 [Rhizophagus irregularis]